jgi:hypothetical protein
LNEADVPSTSGRLRLNSDAARGDLRFNVIESFHRVRVPTRTLLVALFDSVMVSSCGIDTDQFINDMNDQFEDEGEIYYDPNCLDSDGDGWCD